MIFLRPDQDSKLLFLICFVVGGLLDFVFNGVFKIVWFVIYVPAYIAAAAGLMNSLENTRWSKYSYSAAVTLVAGAAVVHLLATGHSRQIKYNMDVQAGEPMTLTSPAWPQKLIVTSEAVATKFAVSSQSVEVVVLESIDYGCIQNFTVDSVAGIDVRIDPKATWVWKQDKNLDGEPRGPGQEDRNLPWCLLKFYRKS